jgi:hypothetical protein
MGSKRAIDRLEHRLELVVKALQGTVVKFNCLISFLYKKGIITDEDGEFLEKESNTKIKELYIRSTDGQQMENIKSDNVAGVSKSESDRGTSIQPNKLTESLGNTIIDTQPIKE